MSFVDSEALPSSTFQAPCENSLQSVRLDLLRPSDSHVLAGRDRVHDPALHGLTHSIREVGLIHPILVMCKSPTSYVVMAGWSRVLAMKAAGLTQAYAFVIDAQPVDDGIILLTENFHRTALNPIAKARLLGRLKEVRGLSDIELSEAMGMSRSAVTQALSLNGFEPDVQASILGMAKPPSDSVLHDIAQCRDTRLRKEMLAAALNGATRKAVRALKSKRDRPLVKYIEHFAEAGQALITRVSSPRASDAQCVTRLALIMPDIGRLVSACTNLVSEEASACPPADMAA